MIDELKTIKTTFFLIFFVILTLFVLNNTKFIRSGPVISITEPLPYSSVGVATSVRGNIKYSKNSLLNGKALVLDKNGNFEEKVLLNSPIDSITIESENQFKKKNTLKIFVSVKE